MPCREGSEVVEDGISVRLYLSRSGSKQVAETKLGEERKSRESSSKSNSSLAESQSFCNADEFLSSWRSVSRCTTPEMAGKRGSRF